VVPHEIARLVARVTDRRASLNAGADVSVLPIFKTASLVGFGVIVAALPACEAIGAATPDLGGGEPRTLEPVRPAAFRDSPPARPRVKKARW
jgi:hypothetical protein